MWSNNAAFRLEHGSGPRPLQAIVAGLVALLAAALVLGMFDIGLPRMPARAEAAALALAGGGGGPTPPSIPRLCFHGSGGELLDFAPRQHCS